EISPLFLFKKQEKLTFIGTGSSSVLELLICLLDNYHLTERACVDRIQTYLPKIIDKKSSQSSIHIEIAHPLTTSFGPFFMHGTDQTSHFPVSRAHFLHITEVMVHYLMDRKSVV